MFQKRIIGQITAIVGVLSTVLIIVSCGHKPIGEGISLTTYSYATRGDDTLRLDVYLDSAALLTNEKHPVFLFSFGGGWEGGKRQDGQSLLEDAAHHGYIGVGIDYRLGIAQIKKQGISIDSVNFASSYSQAILSAVEDLYDATAFLISHAEEWDADTSRIVICGSSAGAINSMTAEYMVCNSDTLATSRLPKGFNYAAVVPFAGGVWVAQTDSLVWETSPCPVLAYHGTADQLVPYEKVVQHDGIFGAFGPAYFIPQLKQLKVPTLFHTYEGGDHIIAALGGSPEVRSEIFAFIDRVVNRHSQVSVTTTDSYFNRPPDWFHFQDVANDLGIKW